MLCIYVYTPSCIKIWTFWVLEDKYKVQQKWIQNMCLLLLDVKGGSYEHSLSFTKPMSSPVLPTCQIEDGGCHDLSLLPPPPGFLTSECTDGKLLKYPNQDRIESFSDFNSCLSSTKDE